MNKENKTSENQQNGNDFIAIVSGSYYWVKCFTDDKYEPTVAVNHYGNGTMYFKFLNGAVRECERVADYKGLRI